MAGRNDALKVATGESVLMLDSDTIVRPGSVETLLDALHSDPQVGLVAPRLVASRRRAAALLPPLPAVLDPAHAARALPALRLRRSARCTGAT